MTKKEYQEAKAMFLRDRAAQIKKRTAAQPGSKAYRDADAAVYRIDSALRSLDDRMRASK